ncbi:hypothetical protein HYS95_01845 [Candidatus Daviesbacteria bacterium]|nr:hypothetical protein [Candidatus Daviesbacteria bacterium]
MTETLPGVGALVENEDLGSLIELVIGDAGFRTATLLFSAVSRDPASFNKFLLTFDPEILIIQTPMPYNTNWPFVDSILRTEAAKGRQVVYVTDNAALFKKVSGQTDCDFIVIPCDLDNMVQTVQRAHLKIHPPGR